MHIIKRLSTLIQLPAINTRTFSENLSMLTHSVPHEESRKIANTHDVMSNHHNIHVLERAKWLSKTSSLARMNSACRDTARKL